MAVHISNSSTSTYSDFATAGETYILDELASIEVGETEGAFLFNSEDVTFRVEGTIWQTGQNFIAIENQGVGTKLEIAESGLVSGYIAIDSQVDVTDIVNDGSIMASLIAIRIMNQAAGKIVNNGSITCTSNVTIYVYELTPTFTIENNGLISNDNVAISMNSTAGTITLGKDSIIQADAPISDNSPEASTTTLDNAGLIRGLGHWAFAGGLGVDLVTNSGRIRGLVDLGEGDDRFVMNGGRILGGVDGGDGDDTFILKKGSVDAFVEAQDGGDDRLTTAVSYSLGTGVYIETIILSGKKNIDITASDGANDIRGNAGNNRIDGALGADTLTGGDGKDIFVFNDGNGYDTITDFKQGEDRIEIGVFAGVDSFNDLHFSQDGTNVVLDVGTGDALVFEHAKVKDFDKHDVFFAS